jgi:hypothetical protein
VDYHPYWVSEQEELAQQNHGGLSLVNLMVTLHLLQERITKEVILLFLPLLTSLLICLSSYLQMLAYMAMHF